MTYSINKVQSMNLFIDQCVIFHRAARVKASSLYHEYIDFLKRTGLTEHGVENYNFWALLKLVAPESVTDTLEKRTYKDLYYVGLDLKANSIPEEKLKRIENVEIQTLGFQNDAPEYQKHFIIENNHLVGLPLYHPIPDKQVVGSGPTEKKPSEKRKRGRPRKNESQ